METLTKEQRREIYLKVASIYGNLYDMDASLCRNICRTMDWVRLSRDYRSVYMFGKMFRLLPEFKLFKPTKNNQVEFLVNIEGLWFSTIDERVICMLLCAEMCNDDIGKQVEFHASRIQRGNPVKGTVVSINDEWIEVKLSHRIEGVANEWEAGEIKSFRKSLIFGAIKGL